MNTTKTTKAIVGEGSAEFRGARTCRVTFTVRDAATGERYRVKSEPMRVSGHSERERKRCIREFRAEVEGRWAEEAEEEERRRNLDEAERAMGLDPEHRGKTFAQLAGEWFAKTRDGNPDVAASTLDKDRYRMSVAVSHFHGVPVREITPVMCEDFKLALRVEHRYSGTTAHGHWQTFKAILAYGVSHGFLQSNPCDGIANVPKDTREKEPMPPREIARFVALLDAVEHPRPALAGFRLALLAGLRCGEACGLRWGDVDLEHGIIHVRRSLCARSLQFKEPKTAAGRRDVPMDPSTVSWLRRFRAQQAVRMMPLGKSVQDSCVVCKHDAEYMHPSNLARSLKRFMASNGFGDYTMHQLRHSYCTQLFAAGVDLVTAQYLMGHDDPQTTLRVYAHYQKANGERAAQAVASMIAALPESNVIELESPRGRWGICAESA